MFLKENLTILIISNTVLLMPNILTDRKTNVQIIDLVKRILLTFQLNHIYNDEIVDSVNQPNHQDLNILSIDDSYSFFKEK